MLERLTRLRTYFSFKPFDTSTDSGRSQERYRRIAMSSISSLGIKCVQSLGVLITIPLTLSYLGVERYGMWMTISSSTLFLGFADFGLGLGLLNTITAADGRGDKHAAATAVSSAFFTFCGMFCVVLAVTGLLSMFVSWPNFFGAVSDTGRQECAPTVWVLAACIALGLPLGITQRVLNGLQDGATFNILQMCGNLAGIAGILVAIYFKAGLPWLALAMTGGSQIVHAIYGFYYFWRVRPDLFPRITLYHWSTAKKMLNAGVLFFALQILSMIGVASDALIITKTIGLEHVSAFSVVQKMFFLSIVGQYFLNPLWPAYGEAFARNDLEWVRRTFRKSIALSVISGAVCAFPLSILGGWLIHHLVSSALNVSASLLSGFFIYVLLHSYIACYTTLFNSGFFLESHVRIMVLATALALPLKILGILKFGVEGMVWGHVIGYGLGFLPLAAWTLHKKLFAPALIPT